MRVLSIDFDIIMYPCIKLYNDMVTCESNPKRVWDQLEQDRGIKPFLSYDARVLLELSRILHEANHILAINNHRDIATYLRREIIPENQETSFDVTNIDFHHDFWYQDNDSIVNRSQYDDSNWLGYLLLHNIATHATWFKACNSEHYPEDFGDRISYDVRSIKELNTVHGDEYDLVFFALSPSWVPYEYKHLYDMCLVGTDHEYVDYEG